MRLAFTFLVLLAADLWAADIPERVLPQGVGLNIHFTRQHERDLDMIAAAGVKFVRMDFTWGSIERQRGQYDWSAYDELTANLEQRGLRALYILDYSNMLYEEIVVSRNPISGTEQRGVASPQHPDSVAAFARWASAAAKHFQGRRIIWEIWNEPNIHFWKPRPDSQQYATLAQATARAIREADAHATIIGPATSQVPQPFLEEVFSAGLLEQLDAVSVHPYRSYHKGPETAVEDYVTLRGLIEKHASNPARQKLPIISGEWGYSTFAQKGVSRETQAAFLVRQQLTNLHTGVPISIWYDWKDDGTDVAEREHNFGIVTHDLKPKPAYIALQTMTRELSGYRVEKRLSNTNMNDWILLLSRGTEQKLAAWTTVEPHSITVDRLQVRTATAVNGDGTGGKVNTDRGALSLNLDALPQYVTILRAP